MWPLFLFVLILDRFLFLPGRMDGIWQYEKGTYIGNSISFTYDIDIKDNFEIEIQLDKKIDSFYLLGCYFGTLYLLDKQTFEYSKYVKYEKSDAF